MGRGAVERGQGAPATDGVKVTGDACCETKKTKRRPSACTSVSTKTSGSSRRTSRSTSATTASASYSRQVSSGFTRPSAEAKYSNG